MTSEQQLKILSLCLDCIGLMSDAKTTPTVKAAIFLADTAKSLGIDQETIEKAQTWTEVTRHGQKSPI